MKSPLQAKHILVAFSKFDLTHRQMLGGILKYAHENCAALWKTQLELRDISRRNLDELKSGGFDGIIAAIINPADRRKYFATGLPVVLYEPTLAKWDKSQRPERSVTFFNDHMAEGRTAAEYFLERGYREFAYVGTIEPIAWNEARRKGFVSALARKGFRCRIYPPPRTNRDFMHETRQLERWLSRLPHGTALFAVHDERAQQVVALADRAGISIPEHIAVLGVDDDELLCTTASPTISSIPVYAAETGYRFAKALDALLHGHRHDPVIRTCHTRVITRRSTDISLIEDPFVSRAVAYMRQHLGDSVGGKEVAAAARCSLRTLQMRMLSTLGRTPKEQFAFLRRTEAMALLANTSLSVDQVAHACGFCGSSHLGLHLKRHLGVKPLEVRRGLTAFKP